jgi:peroxiredoxin
MKIRLILINVFTIIFFASCAAVDDNKFTLSGQIENSSQLKTILLYEGERLIDSIGLDQKGIFSYDGNSPEAALYTLLVGQRPYMLVLQNGEQVNLKADLNDAANYTVSGSETSSKLQELDVIRERFQKQQGALQSEFEQRMNSGEEMSILQNELLAKSEKYITEFSEQTLRFSLENKDDLAGFYGMLILYSVDPTGNEEVMINYLDEVKDVFPNNRAVQSIASHMEEIRPLSIGQLAPDFSSFTPEGKEIKLSDLRGQYVLLDFWAAWCAPCRQENPNIVTQYHAFKDKGFTVLGVSLDRDRAAWMKAIQDDKLDWTHLSDLKMWDSEAGRLYNISAIPASFMIDPDGKIIGKNLRGPALKQFLEKNL